MDLCSTAERYRGGSYPPSDHQNGLFLWPWAAAAAANSYCTPGNSGLDLENLYRFGYNPSSFISQHAHNSSNYSQHLSSMPLFPSEVCMHQDNQYLHPISVATPILCPQISPEHYPSMNHLGGSMKNLSPNDITDNSGNISLIGRNSTPPANLKISPNDKSSLHNNTFHRNKFLSPLSPSSISHYHKYSSNHRSGFNYHSVQHNGSCSDTGPAPTKGYKCKMCQQLCFSRHDLARHNSSAHKQDPRPYRCEHCGRQFSTGAYLGQHRRIHLGIKPYVCRFCERRFTQLSHVQQHERIHTGEKPYRCLSCLKSFTQMSNLQSHQRQHMKGKPYRCEHCFMCFDIQDDLDTHVQAKHAGHKYSKILVCPICGKNYNSETYLNKHIHKHKESAAAANMSVMAAAVNAVAVAAAHLPRHINCPNPSIDSVPSTLSKRDHFYYPSCTNPYSLYSYCSQQPPYFSNSAFMNPDLMNMGREFPQFHSNNIFSDPFEATAFAENAAALCMKKEDDGSLSKSYGEMQLMDGDAASNGEEDEVMSTKSKSNDDTESNRHMLNPEMSGMEAILGTINSNSLPVINFDTTAIEEMDRSIKEDKCKAQLRLGAFNSAHFMNKRSLDNEGNMPSVDDMVNASLNMEAQLASVSDKCNLSRLQELTETSMYHAQHSLHQHYAHNNIGNDTYSFMQPLVFPNFRL